MKKSIHLSLSIFLSFIFLTSPIWAQDITPPSLVSIDVSPTSVDVSPEPANITANITVTAQLTDNSSGVASWSTIFYSPSGTESLEIGAFPGLVDGTATDGTFEGTNPLPQGSEEGTWVATIFTVIDVDGNPANIDLSTYGVLTIQVGPCNEADSFGFPVSNTDLEDDHLWNVPYNYFGNYYATMGGYHSGEDWNAVRDGANADLGKPVLSIGNGRVVKKYSLSHLGHLIAVEHNAPTGEPYHIRAKHGEENGQTYSYPSEYVNSIYSIYIHLSNPEVVEGECVNKGDILGYIMNPCGGDCPHLHFEIRHPDASHSNNWSLVGNSSNWAYSGGSPTGYYLNIQTMVNDGVRHPTEFITNNAIINSLRWLRDQQNNNGSWTYFGRITQENVGLTSMAAASLLNYGIPESDSDVQDAIDWILSKRNPANGSITTGYSVYDTSLAILALKATGNSDYHEYIEHAALYLISLQNDEDTGFSPSDRNYGGWPYYSGMGDWADLSNSQFVLLALHYAEQVNPSNTLVSSNVWNKAVTFLQRCQNREASNPDWNFYNDGGFIYAPGSTIWAGGQSYASMTTAGLWGFKTTGENRDDLRVQDAIDWLTDNYYVNQNYPIGEQFLYYYLYGLAKAFVLWDIDTIGAYKWYKEVAVEIVNRQEPDGHWPGTDASEEPDLVATCWANLALESKLVATGTGIEFRVDSPADLHVYDPEGKHVGINYDTGDVEIQIPGATYSGPGTEPQIIYIPNPIAGTYQIKLVGTSTGDYTLTISGLVGDNKVSTVSYSGSIFPRQVYESTATVSALAGPITIDTTEPESESIPVDIDIKPGSCPNPLNVKSKGVLPLAVLGIDNFDVTTIDPATIRLSREGIEGDVAPLRWSYEDVATPFAGELCDCHDLNGDGFMDLTLKLNTQELVGTLNLEEIAGETIPFTLTGNLKEEYGSTPIEGKDCIWVQ